MILEVAFSILNFSMYRNATTANMVAQFSSKTKNCSYKVDWIEETELNFNF